MKRFLMAFLAITVLLLLAACNTQATTTTDTSTSTGQEATDVTGEWSGDWHRSDGGEEGTLSSTLTQSGSSLVGDMTFTSTTFSYSQDTTISGSVEGNDIVFGMAIGGEDDSIVTIDFEGTISEDGNQMSGEYSMSTGYTGTWSVTKE